MCIIFEDTRIKMKKEQKLKSEEEINGAAINDQRKNKEISQQNSGFSIINTFWNKNKLAFRRHASKLLAGVNLRAIASIGSGEPVQGRALDMAISAAFPSGHSLKNDTSSGEKQAAAPQVAGTGKPGVAFASASFLRD